MPTSASLASHPRDHNNPPSLLEVLSEDHAQLRHSLETLADRANNGPRKIGSDADLDAVSTLVKDARALSRKADDSRKAAKEPYLTAGRDVDTFFKAMTDRIDKIAGFFQTIADDHQRAVVAEQRRRAQEEARKANEEADRQRQIADRAAEAGRSKTAEKHDAKADEHVERAAAALETAQASAADLSRQRTASGALATAKTEWVFEITDYDAIPLDKLRSYIKRDAIEAAIRMAIKMGNRELPGVRIFEDVKALIR